MNGVWFVRRKSIIWAHGGNIWLKIKDGRGTKLPFVMPLSQCISIAVKNPYTLPRVIAICLSVYLFSIGWCSSEAELMQYLRPVGFGPSSNTCPRCAPHLLQLASMR